MFSFSDILFMVVLFLLLLLPPSVYIVSAIIYIHFLIYLFLSRRSVARYERAAANQYSASKKLRLHGLKHRSGFSLR
jgi:Ca2+/Na+ antiporter